MVVKAGWAAVLSVLLTGCGFFEASQPPGYIPVQFVDLQKNNNCQYELDVNNRRWGVEYLAFYLSEPQVRIEGRWQALSFIPGPNQTENLALMQFHHACEPQNNHSVIKLDANQALLDRASAISFTIGVPFKDNHARAEQSQAPLNDKSMFQSEAAGHSFMRIELKEVDADKQPHSWSFMLASGLCRSNEESSIVTRCDKPNRVTLDLPLKANVEELRLTAQLSQILFRANLTSAGDCNLATPEGSECRKVLSNLTGREWIRWDAPSRVYLKQN
ncbi:MbnP family protein [Alteromonas lipotrueiana]|uniref:MbnP family protein n=1 Tax=Alteromonas lipotrueiana TaxID=2803815 RepID=UPI001C463F6A|nr:MbnP family protein [Alteromonas lipotrueiana]